MAKDYDVAQVKVTVGAYTLTGFAQGSKVTVERNEDAVKVYVGSDGEGARSHSHNNSGTVTLRLMQTSQSNSVLSGFAELDRLSYSGKFPMTVIDNSGTSTLKSSYVAASAWVKKVPPAEFGEEVGEREWVIETDNLVMYHGGNT